MSSLQWKQDNLGCSWNDNVENTTLLFIFTTTSSPSYPIVSCDCGKNFLPIVSLSLSCLCVTDIESLHVSDYRMLREGGKVEANSNNRKKLVFIYSCSVDNECSN
jgi:hypothetical protein